MMFICSSNGKHRVTVQLELRDHVLLIIPNAGGNSNKYSVPNKVYTNYITCLWRVFFLQLTNYRMSMIKTLGGKPLVMLYYYIIGLNNFS